MKTRKEIFLTTFPYTLPILAGFMVLGTSYGFLMSSLGFPFYYPLLMSIFIFAGSMQFVAINLLLLPFDPLSAFFLTLLVNARHLFYGLSMLEKYQDAGLKKIYLIYAMCDESFSINSTITIPKDVDKSWFMFFVSLLNQFYWVLASAIGGVLGFLVSIPINGLQFVLTALFVVLFVDQWLKSSDHKPALIGIISASLSLVVFGSKYFMVATMIIVLTLFYFNYKRENR